MRLREYALLIYALLVCSAPCSATQLTISQPGSYQLGSNFFATPAAPNDNSIVIAASNVILDFNIHSISQINTTTGFNGVLINSNVHDVIIKNGIIQNITGTGIILTGSNARIKIIDMSFENCGAGGLLANGLTGTINDLDIQRCQFISCGTTFTNARVADLQNCQGSRIADCVFSNAINNGGTATAITMSNCTACDVINTAVENNANNSGNFVAISQTLNNACGLKGVAVRNNTAALSLTGFLLNEVFGGIYTACSCIGNINGNASLATTFSGFSIINATNGFNIFSGCSVISNRASGTIANAGFSITGTGNVFLKCISNGLASTGNNSVGYLNIGTGPQTYVECIGSYNVSSASATGMIETNSTNSLIVRSYFGRNIGATAATSFGYAQPTTASRISLCENVAFNNGTTSANQFLNVAASATSAVSFNTINATGNAPWTNLGVST
ncbi:hypothetical protein HYX58_05985 [Candidatus Dependentiae bacterium]|nr:hypothetical protein [Candidatus Dependentiae bacterium]